MLSRKGCIPYATSMINHLRGIDTKVYVSSYASEKLPLKHIAVGTFYNKSTFFINSFRYLPYLLWLVLKDRKKGFRIAYFPVFHHWNIFVILLGKLIGIKNVITIHDGVLHDGENHWLHRWMQSKSIQLADHIIFLTDYVRNTVINQHNLRVPTHIIPHGPAGQNFVDVHSKPWKEPIRLLFFGRIVEYKGLDLLLDALHYLPPDRIGSLTIAGMLVNYSLPDNLDPRVNLSIGRKSEKEINTLLQEHDLLVLPYRTATQSGIIPLGISAAIPMVITKVGGLQEQLGPEGAVWTKASPESIALGVLDLANQPLKREQIKVYLRKLRKELSWEDGSEQLRTILLNIANTLLK